jgi:hypothetical protein
MALIHRQKMAAEIDGEFVVFLIGMRINKPWMLRKWWAVFSAMPRMLKELEQQPELGLLGYYQCLCPAGPMVVQYWRSFEHLEAYAQARDSEHLPAWREFNRRIGYSSGDVGIWHETYVVQPGQYEAVYGNMPAFGLGKVGRLLPATELRDRARGRREALAP